LDTARSRAPSVATEGKYQLVDRLMVSIDTLCRCGPGNRYNESGAGRDSETVFTKTEFRIGFSAFFFFLG
jgi:hypothetical protein